MLRLLSLLVLTSLLVTAVPGIALGGSELSTEPVPWSGSTSSVLLDNPVTQGATAMWVDPENRLWESHWTPNGGWEGLTFVAMAGSVAGTYSSDGTLHAVVTEQYVGVWTVYYTSRAPGAEWPGITLIGTAAGKPTNLRVFISPTGDPHVMWEVGESIWHSWRSGGVWSYPVKISYGSQADPEFGPDGALNVVFLGVQNPEGEGDVLFVRWVEGRWFLPWMVNTIFARAQYPRLSVAPDGTAYVAWQSNVPGFWWIYKGNLCDLQDQGFCYAPVSNAKGSSPDILANNRGQWLVWKDLAVNREMVLAHYPGEGPAHLIHESNVVSNLRLEPWAFGSDDRGVRIRWEDGNQVSWYADAWFDDQGRTQTGSVLQWPRDYPNLQHRINLPMVVLN